MLLTRHWCSLQPAHDISTCSPSHRLLQPLKKIYLASAMSCVPSDSACSYSCSSASSCDSGGSLSRHPFCNFVRYTKPNDRGSLKPQVSWNNRAPNLTSAVRLFPCRPLPLGVAWCLPNYTDRASVSLERLQNPSPPKLPLTFKLSPGHFSTLPRLSFLHYRSIIDSMCSS